MEWGRLVNRRVLSGCTFRADGQYGTTCCPSQRNRDTLSEAGESALRTVFKVRSLRARTHNTREYRDFPPARCDSVSSVKRTCARPISFHLRGKYTHVRTWISSKVPCIRVSCTFRVCVCFPTIAVANGTAWTLIIAATRNRGLEGRERFARDLSLRSSLSLSLIVAYRWSISSNDTPGNSQFAREQWWPLSRYRISRFGSRVISAIRQRLTVCISRRDRI